MDADDMDEWLWPDACPELRQMESTLRCLICGDFFHGPVLLPCTHTFCSECVRRFLQSRGASGCCPECKQPCAPGDLVPNRSLEKVGVLFQQMKPKVLPMLSSNKTATLTGTSSVTTTPVKTKGADSKPPERMPLLSYNVMKEKDIKKLLESIGIRTVVKNREDIIQIHKEYVLLANAQADSSHPKSVKQVREEVMRNYRARQQEKMSGRKSSETSSGPPVISAEMQAGFERLRQQVKARKEKQAEPPIVTDDKDEEESNELENAPHEGHWRHVRALQSSQEFYIHSSTHEIRLKPPSEYLEQQQRRENNKMEEDQKNSVAPSENDNEVEIISTVHSTKQSDARMATSEEDDEDFVMITSPPPKPPLPSRTPTPQSSKKSRRSFGTPTAMSGKGYFSQSPSSAGGIPETATQHASSASLPLDNDDATPATPETPNKWECPRCTLVNEGPGLVECEACGYQHRPARKKQKTQFQRTIMSSLSQH